jgi:two-component system, OmpR family, response regulator
VERGHTSACSAQTPEPTGLRGGKYKRTNLKTYKLTDHSNTLLIRYQRKLTHCLRKIRGNFTFRYIESMRILIAEDDPVLADGLTRSLRSGDYAVDCVNDGAAADHALSTQTYDLAIIDLGLPRMDGFEVIKRRKRLPTPPVLVLTARDALQDRVRGLDLGADDYMTKPFELPELEARVRALIRRSTSGGNSLILNGKLSLDTTGRRVTVDGHPLDLSARELGVLEILMLRSGRVVSKDQLAEKLYGWDDDVGTNAIEVCVHRLRKKIEPSGVVIRTIRGLGYLMEKNSG